MKQHLYFGPPDKDHYICIGALIGPSHILTAAHCVTGKAPDGLKVRLGESNVNHESNFYPRVEKDVVSVSIHPKYNRDKLNNDIAIVKFKGAIDFADNRHIAPVCISERRQEFASSRCWVTGWGRDASGAEGKYRNILKELHVPVVGNADCENNLRRTRFGHDFKLHSGFICAGGKGKELCKDGVGGPLICERQESRAELVGLVNWDIGCVQDDVLRVYTKVSEFSDWIQHNTIHQS
ncbi:hypothetical protein GHT06_020710 [Daphnia sinensis]|uniref:Peptidase S1 domain-containing protein n=1 Tax=Daphnia sinensis TaxID=1820382 RepID=A0AAD5L870_9CRUS|nr:hypothetical protein GHT06_020710 [Daphnia sinensis]